MHDKIRYPRRHLELDSPREFWEPVENSHLRVFTGQRVRELGSSQPSPAESVIRCSSPDLIPCLSQWLWEPQRASGKEMQVLAVGSGAGAHQNAEREGMGRGPDTFAGRAGGDVSSGLVPWVGLRGLGGRMGVRQSWLLTDIHSGHCLKLTASYQSVDVLPLSKTKSTARAGGGDRKVYQGPGKINIWTGDTGRAASRGGSLCIFFRPVPASGWRTEGSWGQPSSWPPREGCLDRQMRTHRAKGD